MTVPAIYPEKYGAGCKAHKRSNHKATGRETVVINKEVFSKVCRSIKINNEKTAATCIQIWGLYKKLFANKSQRMGCSVTTAENHDLFLPKYAAIGPKTDVLPTFIMTQWLISAILSYSGGQRLVY